MRETSSTPSTNNQRSTVKTLAKILAIAAVCMIGGLILLSVVLMLVFDWQQKNKPEQIGVSFSQVQAERYGSDWHDNYTNMLEDLGFKHIRVAAYWDRVEPAPGQYNFSELDWMIEQAKQHNAKLTVVVGQKTLRVPECYYPQWLDRNNTKEVSDRANALIAAIAEHYSNEPTIEKWQLENEFLLRNFGQCPKQNLTNLALMRELRTLQRADKMSRPIVLSQSDQFGFPIVGPFTSDYGFSMYRTVWCGWCHNYYVYPQGGWFNWWKAAIIHFYTGANIKIHELQAEAWGPMGNEYLSYDEAQKSMNPDKLADNIAYARSTHIKDFDLWGVEWWYWLRQHGHPQMWEAIRSTINRG
jgi:hypothetical protein